ncbi:MAG: DUF4149 domain-containing protein [Bacteroidetes bacterium]|nr:DUF4149 domain-containing protein [Bacteroidota bacterium]
MLKYLLNIIVYLALAVWIGSLVFFGAGVASVLFQPGMLPGKTMAGAINSVILGRLGTIEIIAGVLLVGGTLYTAARYKHLLNWFVLLLASGMLATAVYYTGTLYPRMDMLRTEIGDFDHVPAEKMLLKAQFDDGHRLYSLLVQCVLGAGVVVLVLHTAAMVRYTELSANRYKTLETEWLRFKETLSHPVTMLAQPVTMLAKAVGVMDDKTDEGEAASDTAGTNGSSAHDAHNGSHANGELPNGHHEKKKVASGPR